jgi:acetyl-CoA carboxylase carboxyl transferase subunit beta
MIKKGLFKKPLNKLEGGEKSARESLPDEEICRKCDSCGKMLLLAELKENFNVCGYCGHHFSISARERIAITADAGTFKELFTGLKPKNILDFYEYDGKLKSAAEKSGEEEAVICGTCKINKLPACVFAMEGRFMLGSMGTVTGEKITLLFEYALEHSLPVVGFCLSGGARMQEGILSLMQMAKTSAAVKRHDDGGNLYISVLTNPTTGGVTASFAMEGDIILAEPKALICFAGPRVIEQTIKQKLPEGFQRAEFLLEKGFIDEIVERPKLKNYISKLLSMHVGAGK